MSKSFNGTLRGYGYTHDVNGEVVSTPEYRGGSYTLVFAGMKCTSEYVDIDHLGAVMGFVETYDGDRFAIPDGTITESGHGLVNYDSYTQPNGYQVGLSEISEQLY